MHHLRPLSTDMPLAKEVSISFAMLCSAGALTYGHAVYLADMSSKSANYCASYESDGTGLLLLCEAELGNPVSELTMGQYDAKELAESKQCISTFGKGRTRPSGWTDAEKVHGDLRGTLMVSFLENSSCKALNLLTYPQPDLTKPPKDADPALFLQYNEYIVYDILQVKLRYLLRTKIKSSLY